MAITDDGIRVWVDDDQLIINQWQGQTAALVGLDHAPRNSTRTVQVACLDPRPTALRLSTGRLRRSPVGNLTLRHNTTRPSRLRKRDTMNRHSKLPTRFLLGLLGAVLITAGMTSVSLASRTYYYGDYFAVVEAGSNYAWFSINQDCDDVDENCAVKVEGTPGGSGNDYTQRWVDELSRDATYPTCGFSANEYGDDQMYADFENCWEQQKSGFTVLWPVIHHNDDFEITPYCKRGDDVCAVELRICFNAADCENNNFRRRD